MLINKDGINTSKLIITPGGDGFDHHKAATFSPVCTPISYNMPILVQETVSVIGTIHVLTPRIPVCSGSNFIIVSDYTKKFDSPEGVAGAEKPSAFSIAFSAAAYAASSS